MSNLRYLQQCDDGRAQGYVAGSESCKDTRGSLRRLLNERDVSIGMFPRWTHLEYLDTGWVDLWTSFNPARMPGGKKGRLMTMAGKSCRQ